LSEQAPGENVPYPLIVVRVQLEHVAVVGECAVDVAKPQERARETGPIGTQISDILGET
jgi:hypothetical protein